MAMEEMGDVAQPNDGQVTDPQVNDGASQPVDLTDDTPVRWPGEKEPIKYGELSKRLQADYTRKTQAASALEKTLTQRQAEWDRVRQAEEQRLRDLATELLRRQNSGQPQDEFLTQLQSKTYIDGPTAAALVKEIRENGLGRIQQAISERDQVTAALYQELMNQRRELQSLRGNHASQAFEGKINRWLTEGGYPEEAKDLAQEIYLAYEGDDLDSEFPAIFEKRWNQLQNIFRAQQQKKLDEGRKRPFNLPKRGGSAVPGKQAGLKGHESAAEQADYLWEMLQASGGDET